MSVPRIVIVGAGVSGLTTAVELARRYSNYDITVVALHIPGDFSPDYVSPYAGADWHSFASPEDKELQFYDKYTYSKLLKLAENEPTSGIHVSKCFNYVGSQVPGGEELPWFKEKVEKFKVIPQNDLPKDTKSGYSFKGVVITVPQYLNFLYLKAISLGVTIKRVSPIKQIHEARELHSTGKKAHMVINCSGLLASKLSGYEDSHAQFPVKGQIIHVRNNSPLHIVVTNVDSDHPDELLYVMPRKEGGSIIGGCMVKDFKNVEEDPEMTKRIIERALKYVPQLVDPAYSNPTSLDIIKVSVGQRPMREGGPRVEKDSQYRWLVHNYGAGGGGYQGSYGFSLKVHQIVRDTLYARKGPLKFARFSKL